MSMSDDYLRNASLKQLERALRPRFATDGPANPADTAAGEAPPTPPTIIGPQGIDARPAVQPAPGPALAFGQPIPTLRLDPDDAGPIIEALVARNRAQAVKLGKLRRKYSALTRNRQYEGTLKEGHNRRNRRVQGELTTLRDRLAQLAERYNPALYALDTETALRRILVELGGEISAIDTLIVSLRQPLDDELRRPAKG